jgi:uncharacterized protein YndB with AHSA1/START domain
MYCWKTSLLIDAPRDRVWETITDFTNGHTWDPSVGRATFETDGPIGQGTRLRVETGGRPSLFTVEEWGPPRLLRLYLTRGKTTGSARFYLTNAPNGQTQLDHTFELDPPFYLEPFMFFAGLKNKRSLLTLKRHVEKKS